LYNRFRPGFCHRVTLNRVIGHRAPGACIGGIITALILLLTAPALAQDENAANTAPEITDPATAQAVESAQNDNLPVVVLQTNLGTLTMELYPEQAPKSVENFLSYLEDDFYNGTVFHRVIEGFMIQGGGLNLRLEVKETRPPVVNEADNGLLNEKFTIAMARSGDPHSATSQFFINTADNTLDCRVDEQGPHWPCRTVSIGCTCDSTDYRERTAASMNRHLYEHNTPDPNTTNNNSTNLSP